MVISAITRAAASRGRLSHSTFLLRQQLQTTRWNSTAAAAATTTASADAPPQLQHCPSLPFIGSTVPQYSKAPPLDVSKSYDYFPEMQRLFGEFYTMGIPGIGVGVNQTVYVISDPREMMKVLRSEGRFPSGAGQSAWGMRQVLDEHGNYAAARILDHGPEWKRVRGFFQSDLLSPQSARQYVPAIAEVARYASRGVVEYADNNDLNTFLEDASFDMFSGLTLGSHTRITDPDFTATPSDVRFCRLAKQGLTANTVLTQDIKEMFLGKVCGIKTAFYKDFEQTWIEVFEIAKQKVGLFIERREKGILNDTETQCYFNQALERQAEHGAVTKEECAQLIQGLLAASVDTTAGMTALHLVHISMHKETQDRIRDELLNALQSTNGILTAETVSPKSAPYLHAAFRESHRLTNPAPMVPMKRITDSITIHGVDIPADNIIVFDSVSKSHDPNLVSDPEQFNPDRWLPDAVEARKGTPAAVLDHPFFKGPFSEGARKCPGSRVAKNESLLLMAQLILDWEMESPVKHWRDVKYSMDTVLTPKIPNIRLTARA